MSGHTAHLKWAYNVDLKYFQYLYSMNTAGRLTPYGMNKLRH